MNINNLYHIFKPLVNSIPPNREGSKGEYLNKLRL